MRCVARRHGLSPTEILRMGTLSGAEALGWSSRMGSITPGKRADLIALPCNSGDPAEAVLQHEGPPTHVWLDGQPIVAN
jgi:imidazolonepropionase-like amidohydrolase